MFVGPVVSPETAGFCVPVRSVVRNAGRNESRSRSEGRKAEGKKPGFFTCGKCVCFQFEARAPAAGPSSRGKEETCLLRRLRRVYRCGENRESPRFCRRENRKQFFRCWRRERRAACAVRTQTEVALRVDALFVALLKRCRERSRIGLPPVPRHVRLQTEKSGDEPFGPSPLRFCAAEATSSCPCCNASRGRALPRPWRH